MTSAWNPDEAREWMAWLQAMPPGELFNRAEAMTLAGHGTVCTYSRKVFIPLTKLCRDVCHYCTFAHRPSQLSAPFLDLSQVLDIARAGESAGCREALFTLGDRPEARFAVARRWLVDRGYATTLEYLADAAALVLKETG